MTMQRPPGQWPGPIGILARILGILGIAALAGALLALALVPFVGGVGVVTRDVVKDFQSLPDSLSTPPLAQRSLILASDGSILATLYYQNRVEVPLENISPFMRQATVAIEDARFLEHNGVDIRGVLRSLATNVEQGQIEQGSSTLTMQYVKNVLVNQATTAEDLDAARGDSAARKLREIRYALGLEKLFSKGDILERYLNIAYFGAGAYGRNIVLSRMADLGYITRDQADRASQVPMRSMLKPAATSNGCTSSWAPFFCDYVVQTIRQDPTFGATPEEREAFLRRGGYTIRTTLDPKAQNGAFDTVTSYIPIRDESRRAAAITMIQPGTGNILAMAQNREWGTEGRGNTTYNYNTDRAMGGTIGMQAGSVFKIFPLAAALEMGVSPKEYVSSPSPATFENFVECETGTPFPPVTIRNSTTSGTLDMARATAYSTNTYFMALAERTGICRPAEIAESMGVFLGNGDPLIRVPTLAIGTMEVTPLAMANAYATFAAHGVYCKPVSILEIRDRDGKPLPVPDGDCQRVLKRDVADTVTVMLNGVVDGNISGRTGANMALQNRPAAGKTGTTNESAAVWFAGYTPQIAAAVWVGDPRGGFAHPMKDVTVNGVYYSQVYGGTLPGPIWRDSMEIALAGTEPLQFDIKALEGVAVSGLDAPLEEEAPIEEAPTFDNSDVFTEDPGTEPAPLEPVPVPADPVPAPAPAPAPEGEVFGPG